MGLGVESPSQLKITTEGENSIFLDRMKQPRNNETPNGDSHVCLAAQTKEEVHIVAGPEFGDRQEHTFVKPSALSNQVGFMKKKEGCFCCHPFSRP